MFKLHNDSQLSGKPSCSVELRRGSSSERRRSGAWTRATVGLAGRSERRSTVSRRPAAADVNFWCPSSFLWIRRAYLYICIRWPVTCTFAETSEELAISVVTLEIHRSSASSHPHTQDPHKMSARQNADAWADDWETLADVRLSTVYCIHAIA